MSQTNLAEKRPSEVVKYIRSEYDRWLKQLGADDPYVGDTTIGLREVLTRISYWQSSSPSRVRASEA